MPYKTYQVTKDDIGSYKYCFDQNDSIKSLPKLEWQFFKNGHDLLLIKYAKESDQNDWAAIYALFPVTFQIEGDKYLAAQSLDTITDKNHRGKGLFITLANEVYQHATEQNVSLVYGFPNSSSVHGFTKKLGWKILDPVPFIFKPLRSKYFFSKLTKGKVSRLLPEIKIAYKKKLKLSPGTAIEKISSFGSEFDQLWSAFSERIKVTVLRDSRYLNWRYVEKPEENYVIKKLVVDNKLVGFIVYTLKDKHGGKVAYIMELIYLQEYLNDATELLKDAINDIINQKGDTILAWCLDFSPNYSAFKNAGFYVLPEKIRPISLHFGYSAFIPVINDILSKRENWFLSYSDSDTV